MCSVFSSFDHKNHDQVLALRAILLRAGYEPIPVNGKSPFGLAWQRDDITEARMVTEFDRYRGSTGTGLRTGRLVGVDIDIYDPDHAAYLVVIVERKLGPALIRYGRKGAMLVYRNSTPIPKINVAEDNPKPQKIEILGQGQQFVGYGIHPDTGRPYEWGDADPAEIPFEELTEVTPEQLHALADLMHAELVGLGYTMRPLGYTDKPHVSSVVWDDDQDSNAKIEAAIAAIPNDLDRDDWIGIGQALKTVNRFDLWSDFSKRWTGKGTNTDRTIRDQWNSFHPRSITAATIYWRADQCDPEWRHRLRQELEKASFDHLQDPRHPDPNLHWWERELCVAIEVEREGTTNPGDEEVAGDPLGIEPGDDADDDLHDALRTDQAGEAPLGLRRSSAAAANDPIDIFGTLTPEPVLESDMLPEPIQNFAFDTADRMGITPATVAMAALAVSAAAIDDRIVIQPTEDWTWTESARLWCKAIGDPGVTHTAALNAACAPLEQIDRQWREEDALAEKTYNAQMGAYKVAMRGWENAKGRSMSGQGEDPGAPPEEPTEPPRRQLIATDFTMEALQEVLIHNPRGVLLKIDELAGFTGGFDAYRAGKTAKDRPLALKLDDGGAQPLNRVGRREVVPNWSACIVGKIQDGKLAEIASTLHSDGLMQRFLPYQIGTVGMGSHREPAREAIERYEMMIRYLVNLEPKGEPITLSECARYYFGEIEKLTYAYKSLKGIVSDSFRAHASKLAGRYARLLLVMHLCDHYREHGYLMGGDPMRVSGTTAKRAYDLMVRFVLPNSLAIYNRFFDQHDIGGNDSRWIAGYILAHRVEKLTVRDLQRARPELKDRKRTEWAVDHLVTANWLTPMQGRQANSVVWKVNPQVNVLFADRADQERQRRDAERAKIAEHAKAARHPYDEATQDG